MAETLASLQAQKLKVDSAISQLINGEKILEFEIGSGATRRKYKYGEVSIEALQTERARLIADIAMQTGETQTFRTTSVMRSAWSKF